MRVGAARCASPALSFHHSPPPPHTTSSFVSCRFKTHHTGTTDILFVLLDGPASLPLICLKGGDSVKARRLFSTAWINPPVRSCDAFTNQNKTVGEPGVHMTGRISSVHSSQYKSVCSRLIVKGEIKGNLPWYLSLSPHSAAGSVRMLEWLPVADIVTQHIGHQCCLVHPHGVTGVLLSPVCLILLVCMAAGRSQSSVRADGAGGLGGGDKYDLLQHDLAEQERGRERERPSELWTLPAHPSHLPVGAYATTEAYCTARWPQASLSPAGVRLPRVRHFCWFQ